MNLQALVQLTIGYINSSKTVNQAREQLSRLGLSETDINAVMDAYYYETRKIRQLRIPPTSVKKDYEPGWYAGPQPGDRCWPPLYAALQQQNRISAGDLRKLDDASSKVVSLLPSIATETFSSRGLVVGYVQSGKTANFSAVIAKAADAGYKVFIVLTGMHETLRRQTQLRLIDELVQLNPLLWTQLTSKDQDFDDRYYDNPVNTLAGSDDTRVLCVIKKNQSRLRRLTKWLKRASAELPRLPILIIDDEADQASINTSTPERRTRINQLLISLATVGPRTAYIGYTATPFANFLIDPTYPQDLYPRDFIMDLPRPEAYFGAEHLFGREPLSHEEEEHFDGLDMIREVSAEDAQTLRPTREERDNFSVVLPASLTTALDYFLLATAARAARGQVNVSSTMLIHSSQYVSVHSEFEVPINAYLSKRRLQLQRGDPDVLSELETLWDVEAGRINRNQLTIKPPITTFAELRSHLYDASNDASFVEENGSSDQRLLYQAGERQVLIVVGGNTLSRGLTLEGLVVSYFIRSASAYDVLLQMGRWFGFRKGYEDLPRVWLTNDLQTLFRFLATVEEEVRVDIKRYQIEDKTPTQLGIRIRTHPGLAITARSKMRSAIATQISFSGRTVQTILFRRRDRDWLTTNLMAARNLLEAGRQMYGPPSETPGGSQALYGLPVSLILQFLSAYHFHSDNDEMQAGPLVEYITRQVNYGGLQQWNVVVVGVNHQGQRPDIELMTGIRSPLLVRSRLVFTRMSDEHLLDDPETANLGALLSRPDRIADLQVTQDEYDQLKGQPAENMQILRDTHPDLAGRGLLLLYPIDQHSMPQRTVRSEDRKRLPLDAVETIIGVAMVFPSAQVDEPVRYMTVDLSRVPQDELPAEIDDGDHLTP